jgi:hypothetical protein
MDMASILKSLRLLADPNRVRIVRCSARAFRCRIAEIWPWGRAPFDASGGSSRPAAARAATPAKILSPQGFWERHAGQVLGVLGMP